MKLVVQPPQVSIRRRRSGRVSAIAARADDARRNARDRMGALRGQDSSDTRPRRSYVLVGIGLTAGVIGARILRERSRRLESENESPAADTALSAADPEAEDSDPAQRPGRSSAAPTPDSDEAVSA